MIVKILQNSKTFNGVNYNENKVTNNQAELVEIKNFDSLLTVKNPTGEDFKKAFNILKEQNNKIKSSQFHVTISCKGREYSKEQLVDIANQWLEKMGYKGLPTLIYFHKDTDNNHVHILTSRVDWNGKKVNHNFEKTRGLAALNKILENDINYKARRDFGKALSYTYSNRSQFAMVLESMGYDTKIVGGKIHLYKYGEEVLNKDVALVDWMGKRRMANKQDDSKRRKQIAAMLYKYTPGLKREQLQDVMRSKFGIELLFHRGKGHSEPYGYSIIDHKNKTVYKGGDILSHKKLEEMLSRRIEPVKFIEALLASEGNNLTTKEINQELKKYGFYILKDSVYHKKSGMRIDNLSDAITSKLKYNFLLSKAGEYKFNTVEGRNVISAKFHVNADDLKGGISDLDLSYYKNILQDAIYSGNTRDFLDDYNIHLVRMDDKTFAVDDDLQTVVDIDSLELEREYYQGSKTAEEKDIDLVGSIIEILDSNQMDQGGGVGEAPKRRKRK